MTPKRARAGTHQDFIVNGPNYSLNITRNYQTTCPIGLFVAQDDHEDWNLKMNQMAIFNPRAYLYKNDKQAQIPMHYPYDVEVIHDTDGKEKYGLQKQAEEEEQFDALVRVIKNAQSVNDILGNKTAFEEAANSNKNGYEILNKLTKGKTVNTD